jgi:hypothetical protein
MHPIARLIFIVAAVVLIGDLSTVPWSEVGRIGVESGTDYPLTFLGMLFAQMRNAVVTATMLIGLGAMVDLLHKNRANA